MKERESIITVQSEGLQSQVTSYYLVFWGKLVSDIREILSLCKLKVSVLIRTMMGAAGMFAVSLLSSLFSGKSCILVVFRIHSPVVKNQIRMYVFTSQLEREIVLV